MANVTLRRNLGEGDARALDLEPAEAREGKQVQVFDDVRDELVLQGLALEGGEPEGGLDLSDPEIVKKLEERQLERELAGGLDRLQQERQRENTARMQEAEARLIPERGRIEKERDEENLKRMDELRNQPPRGPEEQPRVAVGRGFRSEGGTSDLDVEEEEQDKDSRRREEEKRRREPQRAPSPTPATPQPTPTPPQPRPAPAPQPTPPSPGAPRQAPGKK
jgi:hypothetical protein